MHGHTIVKKVGPYFVQPCFVIAPVGVNISLLNSSFLDIVSISSLFLTHRSCMVQNSFILGRNNPTRAQATSLLRFRNHIQTHHARWDSSGPGIKPSQRSLPDNAHRLQETDIQGPGGIRTRNTSMRAAADLRLRPLGHWDWRFRKAIFILRHTQLYCVKIEFLLGSVDVSESSTF